MSENILKSGDGPAQQRAEKIVDSARERQAALSDYAVRLRDGVPAQDQTRAEQLLAKLTGAGPARQDEKLGTSARKGRRLEDAAGKAKGPQQGGRR
jgi:hypothetical protein